MPVIKPGKRYSKKGKERQRKYDFRSPLVSPRHRWKDNVRMDLKKIAVHTRNWVDSANDRDY